MATFSYLTSQLQQHLATEYLSYFPHSFSTRKRKSCLESPAAVSEQHAERTAEYPNLPVCYLEAQSFSSLQKTAPFEKHCK